VWTNLLSVAVRSLLNTIISAASQFDLSPELAFIPNPQGPAAASALFVAIAVPAP